MPYCPECGAQTMTGDPYCGECGKPQDAAPSPTLAPPSPYRTPRPGMTGGANNTPLGLQLAVGTALADRYRIVRRVGGGGMGSVYEAIDTNLAGRRVAVKEMIEMFADETARAKAIEDFKRESELLARLEHPSIPTIYDYFFDQSRGRYYLVMKFIDGGDLADFQHKRGGRVDELTVTQWAIQACDVLDYIHSQNPPLIYRDLKPANLMLDARTSRVMLVDFGIARFVAPSQKGVTAVGTMGYAPPELFSGKVEPRSDIYSLGATMFHLLTGHDPQDNPLLIFDFTKNPKPRQLNPELSVRMEQMICRAVEHEVAARYASAREFGRDLEEHLLDLKAGRAINAPVMETQIGEIKAVTGPLQCPSCGSEVSHGDVFCAFCGAQLIGGQRTTARLIVIGTKEMAAQFDIETEGEHLIGRPDPEHGIRPQIDLSRYDTTARVSRRHAKIIAVGNQFLIEDLNSANGTFINDQFRLQPKRPHTLASGDVVRLGGTQLKFVIN
jgi:eukaryotic-like serine/threonine-protein kinase